jgi:tetratricopeptide (TPR) repeat protein
MADALHQAGHMAEAETLFLESEALEKEEHPDIPLLYSIRGYQYCDLLLGQGEYQDVRERATQTLEWAERASADILSIALDHLSLGRAHLAASQKEGTGDFTQAAEHFDQAVDGLRQAGQQDDLPRGLLARAALHRVRADFEPARRDLDEALAIAERGGMGLHQADGHLEYARLYLAMDEEPEARNHFATAKEMVGRMGYRRRDDEVVELEARLGA